jgi:hypothetical protein
LRGLREKLAAVGGNGQATGSRRVVADEHRPVRVNVWLHAADGPGADRQVGELLRTQRRAGHVDQGAVGGDAGAGAPLVLQGW